MNPATHQPAAARDVPRKGVTAFLALSFGGTWLWLLVARAGLGLEPLNPLLQLPGFCMPGIAAIAVRRWVTREGFTDAGLRPRFRQAWRFYAVAWVGPPLVAGATLAMSAAVGLWHPDYSGPGGIPGPKEVGAVLALMLVAAVLTPLYAGEEFGWTGYLRPRLFAGRTAPSAVVTGLIWAVWHFPLAFIGYVDFSNVVVGLLVWALSFQLQEIILLWLYQRSGSVWVPSLAHAGNNMVLFLILGSALDKTGPGPVAPLLMALAPLAAICAWIIGGGRLSRDRRVSEPTPARSGEATG
ncbi:CPBP family intramembrane glutamic endopeptidase [Streptomyces sp. NBC_00557]|uniref:CPBP family intramembrane glutamic endopeptidase n=1 Tax=Streptomyces sp. NBC_00557 TaxID=2975776 RepID=UPI002E81C1E2|nr:type II CAAX endopeptidase family protein [Streptomyces sp. NBC_00557]WUC39549.1 CPBP family intramembrane metalloprotease [Streptomyces sp. NBC_00557]